MVEKYELVRSKLENKIFTPYGQTVTLTKKTSPQYNDRGEIMSYTSSTSNIVIVPYNIFKDRKVLNTFGESKEGDFDAATQWDTDVAINDFITFKEDEYEVTQIEPSDLKEPVVTIFRMTKIQ